YRDGDRLVQVNETSTTLHVGAGAVTPANYAAWKERVTAFEHTAYFRRVQFNITTSSRPMQVEGFLVSPGFFALLGTDIAHGRNFRDDDASAPGRDDVVILSDGFWRRAFAADPAVVGRKVTVDGTPCVVVGVTAPSFRIFHVLNRDVELFRPLVLDPT